MSTCTGCGQNVCTCRFASQCLYGIELGEDQLSWYVSLAGASGDYVSTPDGDALSATGDLVIVVEAAADTYTPSSTQNLLAKWVETGSQRSYRFSITNTGNLAFSWSTNGTTVVTRTSTAVVPLSNGTRNYFKVQLEVDNGAGGHDVVFAYSNDGFVFTPLGSTVTTAGVTSVFNSTAPVEIGSHNQGTANRFIGGIFFAEVLNNGTLAGRFDPDDATGKEAGTDIPPTVTSSVTNEIWTLQGDTKWGFVDVSTCTTVTGNGKSYAPVNYRPNSVPRPRPYGHLMRTTAVTLPASTSNVPIVFNDVSLTPFEGGMIADAITWDRLTVPEDGYYLIYGFISLNTPTNAGDVVSLLKNGTRIGSQIGATDGGRSVMMLESMLVGDFVQLAVSPPSGTDTTLLLTDGSAATLPTLWAQWMRPL